MSKELDEKWAELVANGRAKWMPRMVDQTGRTFVQHVDCGEALWRWSGCVVRCAAVKGRVPDWDDPATLGALVGQVEARHGGPVSVLYLGADAWRCTVGVRHTGRYWHGPSKAEALLNALEAAP